MGELLAGMTRAASSGTVDLSLYLEPFDAFQLVLSYFNAIVLIFGAVCNATLFVVLIRNRGLRKVRYFLAANLTFADLLLCSINFPIFLFNALNKRYAAGQFGCTVHGIAELLLCSQSVLTLTAITYERYKTVVKGGEITGSVFLVFLPLNWTFSILLAAMPFFWAENPYPLRPSRIYCSGGWYFSGPFDVMFSVFGFSVLTTGSFGIMLMYRKIFQSVHGNACRLKTVGEQNTASVLLQSADGMQLSCGKCVHPGLQQVEMLGSQDSEGKRMNAISDSGGPNLLSGPNARVCNGGFTLQALRNEKVIARVTLTVSLTFFACWGLYNLMIMLEMFTQRESSVLLDGFAATLALTNSACNPFLFLFDTKINSAVKDALGLKYLMWKFGRKNGLYTPWCNSLRSTHGPLTAPAMCRLTQEQAQRFFWQRQAPLSAQNQPNWMGISVVVTINGVTKVSSPAALSLPTSPPPKAGKILGMTVVDLNPGAPNMYPVRPFSELKESARSDVQIPEETYSSDSP